MQPESLLPPEQELADDYGVSKPTLRKALQVLVDCGQIEKINGVGIKVAEISRVLQREIVFLCHDIAFFSQSINRFSEKVCSSQYLPAVIPFHGDRQTQERIVVSVIRRKPAGVVVYADPNHENLDTFKELNESGIPVLYLIRLPDNTEGSLLEFGNADGITGIVEQLYADGCRKFALYADENINPAAALERTQGFLGGMKKCRLQPRDECLCTREKDKTQRNEFFKLFDDPKTCPDAVCAINDACVGNLIRALIKRGVNLQSIRFSGFDHSPLSEFLPCAIMTVEPPMAQMGEVAAQMITRLIENPYLGHQRRKLKAKIVTTQK